MSEKKEMVGMDRKFCPVYVGDTIIDASGVKYTISERGTCVNAAGKDYAFSDLHGPELCSEEQKPVAVAEPTPEVKLLPKRKGGKENKSGLVSLSNLARKLHTKQVGFARTLRDGGVDVVKCKSGYAIHVQDVEKAEQLLAPLSAVIKPQVAKKVAEIKHEVQKQPEGPVVDFEALCEQAKTPSELERMIMESRKDQEKLLGRAPRNLEVTILPSLSTATDQQLAELRRRGYEVTATKTVVVSL